MAETPTAATEISTAPLHTPQRRHDSQFVGGARASTTISILLGLCSRQRGNSMIVRESVTQQLENWRDNWSYSFPAVVIDTTLNLAIVVVSMVMLFWSAREQPNVPARAWICVYALQRVVHVVLVWLEYRRRNRRAATLVSSSSNSDRSSFGDSSSSDVMSDAKRWDNVNTCIQVLWYMGGVVWLLPRFDMHSAPRLFWLTLTFVAMNFIFSAIVVINKGLISGLAVYFFIMENPYFMGGQRGASEAAIRVLPKYKFVVSSDEEPLDVGGRMVPCKTNGPDFSHEHVLQFEDADCCICRCPYEDGTKLHLLPCNHHFHVTCLVKWLKINRTCPLCKYTIV